MNIAILAGGISPERNVSLKGGRAVYKALEEKGHSVRLIDPALGKNGLLDAGNLKIDEKFASKEELAGYPSANYIECVDSPLLGGVECVFILLHGENGEDGKIQSLLDLRGIPYTGSGIKASAVAMDKITTKVLLQAGGVPTPKWGRVMESSKNDMNLLEMFRNELGEHMIVKPNDQGSTVAVTIVDRGDIDLLRQGVDEALRYSPKALVEQFIEGREITVSLLDGKPLPIVEIIPKAGYYDYENKYTKGRTEYVCPADIDDNLTEFIHNLSETAYNILGCSGFARVDFRLDPEYHPYCLEVNTIPGFTELSLFPMAANAAGISFGELCEQLVNLAIRDKDIK